MNNKCLIIGLGQIGMGYDLGLDISNYVLSHARGFYLHPNFDLVGGVDSDVRKCNRFKEVYNLPAYSDITEALEALSPNIIVIATPSDSHLIADKPNLIPLPSILKSESDSFTCGNFRFSPIFFASIRYSVLASLSFSFFNNENINSSG